MRIDVTFGLIQIAIKVMNNALHIAAEARGSSSYLIKISILKT